MEDILAIISAIIFVFCLFVWIKDKTRCLLGHRWIWDNNTANCSKCGKHIEVNIDQY